MDGSPLGIKIRQLREYHGLSMCDLARLTRCSQGYISGIESGKKRKVGKDIVMALADALSVDPIILMDDSITNAFAAIEKAGYEMSEELREFLNSSDSILWIKLAKKAKEKDITAADIVNILDAINVMHRLAGKSTC